MLDCETVPRCLGVEVHRLVEHPSRRSAVQNRRVGFEVPQRQVVVGWLVARKSAIHVHAFHHRESIHTACISVVGAVGHPNVQG